MKKYEFKYRDNDLVNGFPQNVETIIKFEGESMPQLVEGFRSFLRAIGYADKTIDAYLDKDY